MAYEIFKDLNTRTASHNVLRDKLFNTAKNPKYEEYQRGLPSEVYFFFDKKSSGGTVKNENILIKDLLKSYTNQLLEKLIKGKYARLL